MQPKNRIPETAEPFLQYSNGIADDAIMDLLKLSDLDQAAFDKIADDISVALIAAKET